MEEENLKKIRVMVKSLVSGTVTYKSDVRHVRREWSRQNQVIPIPADELQEVLYDQGVYNLFALGYLGIDNPDHRKLVGLEYEGTGIQVIPFSSDTARRLLLEEKDLNVFRQKVANLKIGNIETLVQTACEIKDISYDKMKLIKELIGVDIANLIRNNDDDDQGPNK